MSTFIFKKTSLPFEFAFAILETPIIFYAYIADLVFQTDFFIVLFHRFSPTQPFVFPGPLEFEGLMTFLQDVGTSSPLIRPLTETNFLDFCNFERPCLIFFGDNPLHLSLLFNFVSGHPSLTPDMYSIVYLENAKINHPNFLNRLSLNEATLAWLDSKHSELYISEEMFSFNSLEHFVTQALLHDLPNQFPFEPAGGTISSSSISYQLITNENELQALRAENSTILVAFCHPTCGFCKSLPLIFGELTQIIEVITTTSPDPEIKEEIKKYSNFTDLVIFLSSSQFAYFEISLLSPAPPSSFSLDEKIPQIISFYGDKIKTFNSSQELTSERLFYFLLDQYFEHVS